MGDKESLVQMGFTLSEVIMQVLLLLKIPDVIKYFMATAM